MEFTGWHDARSSSTTQLNQRIQAFDEIIMRILSTNQSKALGVIGLLCAVVSGIATVFVWDGTALRSILPVMGVIYLAVLAWSGLTAKWVAIDADELLIKKIRGRFDRMPLSEVESVRTWPIFRYVSTLQIRHKSGDRLHTLVADQDLTWIMSKMPTSAITPYWKQRIDDNDFSSKP